MISKKVNLEKSDESIDCHVSAFNASYLPKGTEK